MRDAMAMRERERLSHGRRDRQGSAIGSPPLSGQAERPGSAFQELHHEKRMAGVIPDVVERANVGMRERRDASGFASIARD